MSANDEALLKLAVEGIRRVYAVGEAETGDENSREMLIEGRWYEVVVSDLTAYGEQMAEFNAEYEEDERQAYLDAMADSYDDAVREVEVDVEAPVGDDAVGPV